MIPGAGVTDAAGYFPSPDGGFEPSLPQNVREGSYLQAALQALGAGGDALMGLGPAGAAIGMAAKAPRAASLARRTAASADGLLKKYSAVSDAVKAPKATRVYHGSTRGPIVGEPQMWPHRETEIQNAFSVTTDPKIAERYAKGEIGMRGPGPNPTVSEFLLFGETPEYREAFLAADKAYANRPSITDYIDRWLKENGYVGTKFNEHNVKEIIVTDPDAMIPYPNKSLLR
jgi:hypothetical protein